MGGCRGLTYFIHNSILLKLTSFSDRLFSKDDHKLLTPMISITNPEKMSILVTPPKLHDRPVYGTLDCSSIVNLSFVLLGELALTPGPEVGVNHIYTIGLGMVEE